MLNPDRTIQPARRLTAGEINEAIVERARRDALYDWIDRRLTYLASQTLVTGETVVAVLDDEPVLDDEAAASAIAALDPFATAALVPASEVLEVLPEEYGIDVDDLDEVIDAALASAISLTLVSIPVFEDRRAA